MAGKQEHETTLLKMFLTKYDVLKKGVETTHTFYHRWVNLQSHQFAFSPFMVMTITDDSERAMSAPRWQRVHRCPDAYKGSTGARRELILVRRHL